MKMDNGKPSSSLNLPLNAEATSSTDNNVCSICKCADGKIAEISDVDELKSIKNQIIEHSSIIKKVTHACLKCLYKLYTFIEQNRIEDYKKSRNQQLFAVGDLIVETGGIRPSISLSSNSSSSSNISIIPDDKIFEREFFGGKNIEYENDSDENNIGNEEAEPENVVEGACIEDHHYPRINFDHSSQLAILFERSESALVSESGGNPDQYKPRPQRCLYCPKTFVRPKMFNRHLRSHESKLRSRSRSSSKFRATPTNIVFKCDDCPTTFSSSQLLRKHSKIHLKQHSCNYCHLYFFTTCERDIHQAECFGKEMAKTSITRHSTRSVTRSLAARSQYSQSDKNQESKSQSRSISRIYSTRNPIQSLGYDDEDNDDDEVSVSCSDHFSLVQSWVNKTCKMLSSEIVGEPPVVLSQKEYDIVMLERLIEQSEIYQYTCTFIGCDYITSSLRDMSFHEVKTHKSKTYYNCPKCKGRFTSKLFLDYHLYMQNYGEYHCNKCTMTFIYEYKLQHHLLQHQQHESFPCLYCDSSYMSETELRIHAIETGHNTKKRKKTISIDRSMTIANETAPTPLPPKRMYQCKEKLLYLPKTETKRPMQIIWPKYTKIFLGDLDFEYEPGRNCARTN
ncbi:zinc finger protein 624 [Episyrphus balteatus]|uniref:zinc finger protein 624 n=1 Tax=Episyrphus balteatus TaxID=286459 RepID=UPI002486BC64|nr:zinc finger protein 624 [Episyrphus balteatus]